MNSNNENGLPSVHLLIAQSIIYYVVRCPNLEQWVGNSLIQDALKDCTSDSYTDCDPTFTPKIDEDYDLRQSGISRESFCDCYLPAFLEVL